MRDDVLTREVGGVATASYSAPAMERVIVRGLQAGIDSQATRGAVAVQLIAMLHAVLDRLTREASVEIRVRTGAVTVNGANVVRTAEDRPAATRLATLFEERGLDGIDVVHGISIDELADGFRALAHPGTPEIQRELEHAGVRHVVLRRKESIAPAPVAVDVPPAPSRRLPRPHASLHEPRGLGLGVHRAVARHAYAQLVTAARAWYSGNVAVGAAAETRATEVEQVETSAQPTTIDANPVRLLQQTKRAVQRVIDLMQEDDACIVGLACTRAGGDDMGAHATRVTVLTLAVARQAGHRRSELQTVGLAALLHDVGVHGAVCEPGFEPRIEHNAAAPAALRGAAHLLATLPADAAVPAALAALAPGFDAAGAESKQARSLALARLIRIADLYDMLLQRDASTTMARPDAALHFVFEHAADAIDAALAQRFAAVLGVFPPGSVVQLDSGEIAVVVRANAASVDRPQVLLVRDSSGTALDGTECIDLATGRQDGKRSAITAPMDPGEAGIEPLEWFIADPWMHA